MSSTGLGWWFTHHPLCLLGWRTEASGIVMVKSDAMCEVIAMDFRPFSVQKSNFGWERSVHPFFLLFLYWDALWGNWCKISLGLMKNKHRMIKNFSNSHSKNRFVALCF
jgi:hypothetical protein